HVAVRERPTNPDRDGLLADRDVQEPRQLAGAEALLDLLLEAPDQEHLPEELAQGLLRDPAALLDFRHGRDSTLPIVALVERFSRLQADLPDDWQSAQVRLAIPDEGDCARATALLAPANPGRRGKMINFTIARRGDTGLAPEQISSLLRRLDDERIQGTMALIGIEGGAPPAELEQHEPLAAARDQEEARLPSDWSDLYAEVELFSTDYIEPGALRLSPLNPTRPDARPVFRFRAA